MLQGFLPSTRASKVTRFPNTWRSWPALLAVLVVFSFVLAACGGGSGDTKTGSGEADPNGTVAVYGTEPENPLVPTNTNELGGTKAVQPMFAADAAGVKFRSVMVSMPAVTSACLPR